MTCRQTLT